MGKIKTYIKPLLTAALSLGMASPVFAQITKFPTIDVVQNVSISKILLNITNWMIGLAGALAVIFLIYGGIIYITGGPKGEENAKKIIINAIIGIVVIAISLVLVNMTFSLLSGGLSF